MKVIAQNLVTHLNMLVFRNSIADFTCVTRVQDDIRSNEEPISDYI